MSRPTADAPTSIRTETTDGVLAITLDRPDALNALDGPMKAGLLAAFRGAARDPDVRAVLLTGAGRAFCAGQDLKERAGPEAPSLATLLRDAYNPLILAMRRLEKPIVGAINGVAAGAGASLAFACDLRVAAEEASFVMAFGRVGLIPDSGATWHLPRLIGRARAAELIFTTDPIGAAEAERIGLVNRVVPGDRLLQEARELAVRLATGPTRAIGLAKRALDRSLEVGLEAALDYEADLQGIAGRTDDHREGVAAFVEKRPARFTGG